MTNQYYFTDEFGKLIYYAFVRKDRHLEVSLYCGDELYVKKSLPDGDHLLEKNGLALQLSVGWFSVTHQLTRHGERVKPAKTNRKELRTLLRERGIFNELNPPPQPIRRRSSRGIWTVIILFTIGLTLEFLTQDRGKGWFVLRVIFLSAAYYQLCAPLIDLVPDRHMDEELKATYKFLCGIGGMIATSVLIAEWLN